MRHYLAVFIAVLLLVVPWLAYNYPQESLAILQAISEVEDEVASVILSHKPKTIPEIQSRYNDSGVLDSEEKKVRILLVPGHEPSYGGAEFGSLKERDMTVEFTDDLKQFIQSNSRLQVFTTRDIHSWDPIFSDYFKNNWDDIVEWQGLHKSEIINMTRLGQYRPSVPVVFHNTAPENVALRLFGIDKWANDNDIDVVIHAHFNDYPSHPRGVAGDYSGFAIYIPDRQYLNSTTTKALAESIFKRLSKYSAVSNLPGEKSGIVEDQDLIAVGSYNSVDAASMLIEYGYIYESQFTNPRLRSLALKDLAFQTYIGLEDFLDRDNAVNFTGPYDTLVMPYRWSGNKDKDLNPSDVFALQTALIIDGDYPPKGMSMNDCPRAGAIGPCTKNALGIFQNKYSISGETNEIGPKTLDKLNSIFGG